jgi:oxygen-dependent protoporphyrinogen oxidase
LKVAVVGAGISGLATAWNLRRLADTYDVALDLVVYEANATPGGNIRTEAVPTDHGSFLVEWGPNGFLDSKPETVRLCRELGLQPDLLPADESAANRYLFLDGRLQQLPTSPGAFLKSSILPLSGRLRALREPYVRSVGAEDESVYDFAARRLGVHAADRLVDPFVSGIFAGDPKALSVRAAFPRLTVLENQYGSLIRAQKAQKKERAAGSAAEQPGPRGHLTSLTHGMSQLIDALQRALGSRLETGVRVERVRRFKDGWVLDAKEGTVGEGFDHVVISAPSLAASRLLAGLDRDFEAPLSGIDYAPVAVVAMGFAENNIQHPLNGFGFLVPSIEERGILGCLWSSSIFPGARAPAGFKLLRVMVGGARAPEIALQSEDALKAHCISELDDILGLCGDPVFTRVIQWTNAIPQYGIGHMGRVTRLDEVCERWPGLHLTGNAYRGVAVNDCSREAVVIAERVLGVSDEAVAKTAGEADS